MYVQVHVFAVSVKVFAHVYSSQRTAPFLWCSLPDFLIKGLSLAWGLPGRLVEWPASLICVFWFQLSVSSQHWLRSQVHATMPGFNKQTKQKQPNNNNKKKLGFLGSRDRLQVLLLARQALYQLSYFPSCRSVFWTNVEAWCSGTPSETMTPQDSQRESMKCLCGVTANSAFGHYVPSAQEFWQYAHSSGWLSPAVWQFKFFHLLELPVPTLLRLKDSGRQADTFLSPPLQRLQLQSAMLAQMQHPLAMMTTYSTCWAVVFTTNVPAHLEATKNMKTCSKPAIQLDKKIPIDAWRALSPYCSLVFSKCLQDLVNLICSYQFTLQKELVWVPSACCNPCGLQQFHGLLILSSCLAASS